MNYLTFAAKNVLDKLDKCRKQPRLFIFYFKNYVLAQFTAVRPDVYIISYPKCGRTWLRVMLLSYLDRLSPPRRAHYNESLLDYPGCPLIGFDHDWGSWIPAPPKTERLRFKADKYRGRKVIFICRDPRDVLVSSFYHLKYRERIFSGELADFIRHPDIGMEKILAFFNLWLKNKEQCLEFMLIRYEDLHRDCRESFKRILDFVGLPLDKDAFDFALAQGSFASMKEREKGNKDDEPWVMPGAAPDERAMKMRQGKVGGYRDEFSAADMEYLDRFICERLSPEFGY